MNPVVAAVAKHRLLLLQDKSLPNAVTVITGEHPHGSWWAHPRGHEIFRLVEEASEHPDIIATKLVGGKVTFVHRSLWPAVLAIGSAREAWQLRGLSSEAKKLLRTLDKSGQMQAAGKAAKELETRLLARGDQVHSESGRHQTLLETWPRWASRVKLTTRLAPAEGREEIERALADLGSDARLLPWNTVAP